MRRVGTAFDFAAYRIPAVEAVGHRRAITHGLPKFFPDRTSSYVGRSLLGRAKHQRPVANVPFRAGSHHCRGRSFAKMLLPLMLGTAVHDADIELFRPARRLRIAETPLRGPDTALRFKITGHRG